VADKTNQKQQDKPKPAIRPVRPRIPRKQLVSVRRGTTSTESKQDQGSPPLQRAAVQPTQRATLPAATGTAGTRFAHDFSRVPARTHSRPAVQRENGEGPAGGAAAEGVQVPSVAGGSDIALAGDILTALDTTLTVADLVGGAAGLAVLETVGFMALAGGVGALGAIFFIIGGLFTLADAWLAGQKWAAVQGASYAIVSHAYGRRPPPAPGWMGEGDKFNETARQVTASLSRRVNARNQDSKRVVASLINIRKAQPETILNQIYQRLVEEHLQATFLRIRIGGVLYQTARRSRLSWPAVHVERTSGD
jgi:hypothetical protein